MTVKELVDLLSLIKQKDTEVKIITTVNTVNVWCPDKIIKGDVKTIGGGGDSIFIYCDDERM